MATIRIFIPLYNAEEYILETLNSVKSQTFQDWDCVISDDKSTDNSVEIVKKFIEGDSRFKLLLNEKHLSVASNWNLSKANNNSLATKILCSDDVLYPHCLEYQIKLLNEYKTSIVFNRRDILLPSGRKISPQTPSYVKSINANDAFAIYVKSGRNIFGEPISALIRTKDLLESEGFSESHQYTLDLSGYHEISKNKQVTFDKEIVGFFRVSKSQWSYKIRHKQNSAQIGRAHV